MSIRVRSQSAHQLFDKVARTRPASKISSQGKTYAQKWTNFVDPNEHFTEDDIPKSWTSRISNLVQQNRPQEALGLFKAMLTNEHRPNFITVLVVIKAITSIGTKDLVRGIHGYSIKIGIVDSQIRVATALVTAYSYSDLRTSRELFNQTPNKDVVLCSAMISVYVNKGTHSEAFELLRQMLHSNIQPNEVTISVILAAAADTSSLKLGREIHGYSAKQPWYSRLILCNSLLSMYSKCRRLETALLVFGQMQDKDIVSWRNMIHGCVENGNYTKALDIFYKLRGSSRGNEKIDRFIIQQVIKAFSQLDENYNIIKHGLVTLVLKIGLFTAIVVTELVQLFSKLDDIESAENAIDLLVSKDVISWSAMAAAYAQSSKPSKTFDILKRMQLSNVKPNEFTFVSLLLACISLDSIEIGETIQARITKSGYSRNTFLTSSLIDMYCKFGKIKEGEMIFHENPLKDFICWSSVINGYRINGCGEEVLECFSEMLRDGIEPNDVVFISVLSACSHCGLDYEGWYWFRAMEKVYKIKPSLAHYACMVDMLSRQGNIKEALEFVNGMPLEPDKRIWGAILAGCRNTDGSGEILEFVAKKLIDMEPEESGYYVVLSNLYAEQGRWEEVEKLRSFIDSKCLKKDRAYSVS